MTTYLCAHPSHRTGLEMRPVDITAQVRLERSLVPRALVHLACTEDVVQSVHGLDARVEGSARTAAVCAILTGEDAPVDAPVFLLSRSNIDRAPGLYELDELRSSEPIVDRIADRWLDASAVAPVSDDVIVVDEPADPRSTDGAWGTRTGVATQTRATQTRVVPQGAHPLMALAHALAEAPSDPDELVATIAATPPAGPLRLQGTKEPWRVVVTCPVAEGLPAITHRTVFTGDGTPEPPVVTGTPAGGSDLALEDSAAIDLAPSLAVGRLERRLGLLLIGEIVLAALIAGSAWLSGGLAFAARETPVWLSLAIALAAIAIVFAVVPRFAPNVTDEPNDTFELRRYYDSRLELFGWAPALSAGAFALALLFALAPPALARDLVVGAPSVTFDASADPVIAHVAVTAHGVAIEDVVMVEIQEFADGDAIGTVAGRVTTTGDATGNVPIDTSLAIHPQTRYLSVRTWTGDGVAPICTPAASSGAGCSVVAVPPLGAGVVATNTSTSLSTSSVVVTSSP